MNKKTYKIKKLLFLFILLAFSVTSSSFIWSDCSTSEKHASDHIKIQLETQQEEKEKQEKAKIYWQQIQELYLPSLIKQEPEKENTDKKDEKEKDKDPDENLLEAFSKISEEEKIKLAFDLFTKCDVLTTPHEYSRIVDDTTYRDLDIFCGKPGKTEHNFVKLTDKTYTIAGTIAYLDLLYHPTNNIEKLIVRQNGIRELVDNESLYYELSEKLKKLAVAETKLLACWHEHTERTINSILERFYAKGFIPLFGSEKIKKRIESTNSWFSEKVNQSSKYVDIKRIFELGTNPVFDLAHIALNMNKKVISQIVNNPLIVLSSRSLERFYINLLLLGGTWYLPKEHKINIWRTIIGGFIFYCIWNSYKDLYKREKASLTLHKIMNEISAFIVTAQEVINIIKSNPVLHNAINTCMQPNEKQSAQDQELKTFIKLLDNDYFKKEPRLLGLRGKALATFFRLKKLQDEFIPHYTFIGKVDTLLNIATLLKHNNACYNNYYDYARYVENNKPVITLQNFWNPFINPDKAVANDLVLDHNIILTGPNAGGKSTTLKAIALSALLAQTLTIAPGTVELAPFNKIITLLNITDTPGQESGFQAHAERVKFALETLNSIAPHEFVLLAPDELYNTTAEDCATALYYGIVKHITYDFPNAIFIGATHYAGLNELEKETKGLIRNYKVKEAYVGLNGELSWEYKLEPGINKQNIALQITEQLYGQHCGSKQSEKILREAKNKLHRYRKVTNQY